MQKIDSITGLPKDVLISIFDHLTWVDGRLFGRTCKYINEVSKNESVVKKYYLEFSLKVKGIFSYVATEFECPKIRAPAKLANNQGFSSTYQEASTNSILRLQFALS